VVGYIKGKSAIHIARTYLGQKKNYGGMSFWARGYFVSTVGTDEDVVRTYILETSTEDIFGTYLKDDLLYLDQRGHLK
jgi:putative transposase